MQHLSPLHKHPSPQPTQVREFSFLANPRAAALQASTAKTALAASASSAVELKRLVADYGATKVLHITNKPIGALDNGWLDDETQRKFKQRFSSASGSWCCAPGDEARKGAARSSYFRLLARPSRFGGGIRYLSKGKAKGKGKGRGIFG